MDSDDNSSGDEYPTPIEAVEGEKPLAAEMQTETAGLFPPDIDPTVHVGGSPEEQQILREEMDVAGPGTP